MRFRTGTVAPDARRAGVVAAIAITLVACRQQGPTSDPNTPPNSPLPRVERPDEPAASPAGAPFGLGDAGAR